jgi:hypothetical protein
MIALIIEACMRAPPFVDEESCPGALDRAATEQLLALCRTCLN